MFNEVWLILAGFVMLVGLVLHQDGLMTISSLLLTVAGVGWVWKHFALRGVEYERNFSERRAFVGEVIDLTITVTNRKPLPLAWLRIEDEYPLPVGLLDGTLAPCNKPETAYLTNLLSLRWYERVRWRYRLQCSQRGVYAFGPAKISSGDLFGLFSESVISPKINWLIVYPQVRPLEDFELPPKEPFGEIKARQRIFEDPSRTIGVRDYHAKDAPKRIHWKATARQQKLQVRVYEPTTIQQLAIFMNIATLPKVWHGVIPSLLEKVISVTASIAAYGIERRWQVGVLANGCWPQSDQPLKVLPGRSPDQLTSILESLAAVTSVPTISIEEFIARESPRLPWGATLVVVSAVLTEELMVVLARLHDAGRRLALVSLDEKVPAPQVPGLLLYRVREDGEVFRMEPLEEVADARSVA